MDLAPQSDVESAATIDLTGRADVDVAAKAAASAGRAKDLGAELLGRIHPDDHERTVESTRIAPHRRDDFIVRMQADDGSWVEVRCSMVPITPEEPRPRR